MSDTFSEEQSVLVLIKALKNVFILARRERRRAKTAAAILAWEHIIRFCNEAGFKSSILREVLRNIPPDDTPLASSHSPNSNQGTAADCEYCGIPLQRNANGDWEERVILDV